MGPVANSSIPSSKQIKNVDNIYIANIIYTEIKERLRNWKSEILNRCALPYMNITIKNIDISNRILGYIIMLQNRNKFIFFSSNHYISCLNFIWRAIAMIDYIKIKLKKRFFVNLGGRTISVKAILDWMTTNQVRWDNLFKNKYKLNPAKDTLPEKVF